MCMLILVSRQFPRANCPRTVNIVNFVAGKVCSICRNGAPYKQLNPVLYIDPIFLFLEFCLHRNNISEKHLSEIN